MIYDIKDIILLDANGDRYFKSTADLFNTIIAYKNQYIHTDNDGDYFIEVIGNTIYIYFEESDTWCDWVSNFDFIVEIVKTNIVLPGKSYKDSSNTWHTHRGFRRVWKSMKDDIETTVKEIIEERLKLHNKYRAQPVIENIVCSGYSHGAALCGMCVEDMEYLFREQYNINVYGYGFGCPRFTWGKLPKEVKDRFRNFYVIRNGKDLVTHVPPKIFGYGHGTDHIISIKPSKKYNCIEAHMPKSYSNELKNIYLNDYNEV